MGRRVEQAQLEGCEVGESSSALVRQDGGGEPQILMGLKVPPVRCWPYVPKPLGRVTNPYHGLSRTPHPAKMGQAPAEP